MNELKDIIIHEVSFVDEGANPAAHVLFYKRKGTGLAALTARLEARLAALEDEEMLKIAGKYGVLGEEATELAATLKAVKKESAKAYETVIKKLDAALSAVEKSGLYAETGKSGLNPASTSLEEVTMRVRKAKPALTYREARDEAYRMVMKNENNV